MQSITGFPQKSEDRIPWLFHDWFAFFHDSHSHMVSDMVMIVPHNMHDNNKLESCHSHENKQFHDFSMTFWEIFIFQDFSMTFHNSNFFQDFPWPWEPWIMTLSTFLEKFCTVCVLCTLYDVLASQHCDSAVACHLSYIQNCCWAGWVHYTTAHPHQTCIPSLKDKIVSHLWYNNRPGCQAQLKSIFSVILTFGIRLWNVTIALHQLFGRTNLQVLGNIFLRVNFLSLLTVCLFPKERNAQILPTWLLLLTTRHRREKSQGSSCSYTKTA